MRIGRFFLSLLFLLTLCLTGFELYQGVLYVLPSYKSYLWLGIGMAICAVLLCIFKRNKVFFQTMAHEGAHIIVGLLFFKRIQSFKASSGGNGEVIHYGGHNMFISLAPYCSTYLTYFLLVLRLIILPEYVFIIDLLVGFTLAFHLSCFLSQTRTYQPDIQLFGKINSLLFIFTFLFFNLTIVILAIKLNLLHAFSHYFESLWQDLMSAFSFVMK